MQTQRPNPHAALLGRLASSFTVAELAALPKHTAFGRPDLFNEGDLERLAYASNGDRRWCSAVGPVDSATLRKITGLVCIAVGEPEVLGVERPADDVSELARRCGLVADIKGRDEHEWAYFVKDTGAVRIAHTSWWDRERDKKREPGWAIFEDWRLFATVEDAVRAYALDHVLPRPTRSLREIAEDASAPLLEPRVIDLPPRAARISAADMEEPLELVYRLRRWCGRTGADLSLLVDAHRVSVMFIGDATPDLVDAVQVGGHRQHTDAAGTVTIWRAS